MDTRTEDLALLKQVRDKINKLAELRNSIHEKKNELDDLQEESLKPGYYHEESIDTESDLNDKFNDERDRLMKEKMKARNRAAKIVSWLSALVILVINALAFYLIYCNSPVGSEDFDIAELIIAFVLGALFLVILPLVPPKGFWFTILLVGPLGGYALYMTSSVVTCVILVATVVIIILSRIIRHQLEKEPQPIPLTDDQMRQLREAKKTGERNRAKNESNRADALRKKQEEYAPKIKACEAEIQKLEKQKAQLEAEIDAIDGLSKKDKHPETIDFLIECIESRRADSLKEALQQYDAAGRPKSTYYGRDWDLSKGISASDLPKFEDDLCELMEVLAHTDDSYEMAHNWFARHCLLFTQSIVTSDDAVKKSYEVSSRVFKGNLKGNQSWIIKTAGILSACVGTNILASILNGHVVRSDEGKKVLSQCESEKPLTAEEKVVMKNAYIILNRLTSVLYEKFKKKM